MSNWIDTSKDSDSIVLSSRVRLARNLNNNKFPGMLGNEEGKTIVREIEDAFYKDHDRNNFKTIYLWNQLKNDNLKHFERHLISKKLLDNNNKSAFILSSDENVSIMINEEDHIRLQYISEGFNIKDTYDKANIIDDALENHLDYAFDEKLGYITSCPTNLGTGLRVSAMMHLPSLTLNNEINDILKALTQIGMTIRGLYGEGSKADGNIYQVSNQITLGVSENDILDNLEAIVTQLTNQELKARELISKEYKYELEDKVFRSLGILKEARILSSKELLDLLSNVRLGKEMGIINNMSMSFLNKLLIDTQVASLQSRLGREMNHKERDIERANLVRERLKNIGGV